MIISNKLNSLDASGLDRKIKNACDFFLSLKHIGRTLRWQKYSRDHPHHQAVTITYRNLHLPNSPPTIVKKGWGEGWKEEKKEEPSVFSGARRITGREANDHFRVIIRAKRTNTWNCNLPPPSPA